MSVRLAGQYPVYNLPQNEQALPRVAGRVCALDMTILHLRVKWGQVVGGDSVLERSGRNYAVCVSLANASERAR